MNTLLELMDNHAGESGGVNLRDFPAGVYEKGDDILFDVSSKIFVAYNLVTESFGLRSPEYIPTPGCQELRYGSTKVTRDEAPQVFHDALAYLRSPQGLFSRLICARDRLYYGYGVDVNWLSDCGEIVKLFNRKVLIRFSYTPHGVIMNDRLVTTYEEAFDYIRQLAYEPI